MPMPYIEKITKAGKTILVERTYSTRYKMPDIIRTENKDKTSDQQERVNYRKALRELTLLMNENFKGGDYHLTLNYKKDERPATPEEAKRDREKFIRKLRKKYKDAGQELKYIVTTEFGKRGHALHHHLVVNAADPSLFNHWKKGRPTFTRLDDDGEYSDLAAYFLKGREDWKAAGGTGRQWTASRNLRRPDTHIRIVKTAGHYYEHPRPRKGYYVKEETVTHCIHEGGYPYMRYILVQNERRAP